MSDSYVNKQALQACKALQPKHWHAGEVYHEVICGAKKRKHNIKEQRKM
jgi:hypothetical protein